MGTLTTAGLWSNAVLTNIEFKQERKENSTYLSEHITHSQGSSTVLSFWEGHAIKLKGCQGEHGNILHRCNSISICGSEMLPKCKAFAGHYQFSEGGGLADPHNTSFSIMLDLLARYSGAEGQILKSLFSPSPRGCSHRDHKESTRGSWYRWLCPSVSYPGC